MEGIPTLNSSDGEIKDFLLKSSADDSAVRSSVMCNNGYKTWMIRGRQWITKKGVVRDGSGIHQWHYEEKYRYGSKKVDRPTTNKLSKAVRTEAANLIRRQYIPHVIPEDRANKELREAADLAEKKLQYDLKEVIPWWSLQEAWAQDLVEVGTAIGVSYLDERETNVMRLPQPNSARCPVCGEMYGSTIIEDRYTRQGIPDRGKFGHADTVSREGLLDNQARMINCPVCQEPTELDTRWAPLGEELDHEDMFGASLGWNVPKGIPMIDHVHWSELYPENDGIGVEPDDCRIWTRKRVVSLEWVFERHSDLANKLEPLTSRELLKLHPLLADPRYSGTQGGKGVYQHHTTYIEQIVLPHHIDGLEKGRYSVLVGNVHILPSRPLMVDVPLPNGGTKAVPRMKFAVARYMRDPGYFWGRCAVDDAIEIQIRRNKLSAQVDDLNVKGMPNIYIPGGDKSIDIRHQGEGSFRTVEVEPPIDDPTWTPQNSVFPNQPITGTVYLPLLNALDRDLQETLGPTMWQAGQNVPGVKAARHLQLLIEEENKTRDPREKSLKRFYEALCTHRLELEWAFSKDESEIMVEISEDKFERKSYKGTSLLGQTKVSVEMSGDFEKTVIEQEMVAEGVKEGWYGDVSSPRMQYKLRKMMNWPEITQEISRQITRIEELIWEFGRQVKDLMMKDAEFTNNPLQEFKSPVVPAFDESIHDAGLWYESLGSYWLGNDAIEIQDQLNWDDYMIALAGWQRRYDMVTMQDLQVRQVYEGIPGGPEGPDGIPIGWMQHYMKLNAQRETVIAMQQERPPGINIPIQPPPEIVKPPKGFMPADRAQRILVVWRTMLRERGIDWKDDQRGLTLVIDNGAVLNIAFYPMLRFYAAIQHCRLVQEEKQKQLLAGQMQAERPAMEGG